MAHRVVSLRCNNSAAIGGKADLSWTASSRRSWHVDARGRARMPRWGKVTGSLLIGRGFHSPWWDMRDILPGADTPAAWARPGAAVKAGRRPPAKRVALTGAE